MKLQPMTDYVLEQNNKIENRDNIGLAQSHVKIVNYANFLKQPLKIWMFIPCDENDVPFKEPKICCSGRDCGCMGLPYNYSSKEELQEYQQAKERVLFKGFEIIQVSGKNFILLSKENYNCQFILNTDYSFYNRLLMDKTIENLVKYNLELTDSACEQVNL